MENFQIFRTVPVLDVGSYKGHSPFPYVKVVNKKMIFYTVYSILVLGFFFQKTYLKDLS